MSKAGLPGSAARPSATPLGVALAAWHAPVWLGELRTLLGEEAVLSDPAALWVYSRDRAPYSVFSIRRSRVPASLPSAIACPANLEQLQALVRFARQRRIPVLPLGAGSGVLGGALPVEGELVIDLKRLNQVLEFRAVDSTVVVQAGLNGAIFESWLNARGYTSGHHPQSLHMSTVGGWVACRGAGQSSTRYGKIEDMVLGCDVVLPDGRLLSVPPVARRAVGPGIKDLFVGSEGVFGIIASMALRVWPLPEARLPLVLAFPDLQSGFDAIRTALQSEIRPAIARLYDLRESAARARGRAPFATHPVMAMFEFAGSTRLAALERELMLQAGTALGAVEAEAAVFEEWRAHRYLSLSTDFQARDWFADTLEVTGRWSTLAAMHSAIARAAREAHPKLEFSAHWSHAYPEGVCQYMTFRLPPMAEEGAQHCLFDLADALQRIALEHGGSISHHHGIGLLRGQNVGAELGIGLELLQALKDHLDPDGLLVPGKLGMARQGLDR